MNTLRLRYAVPNLIERITNRKALDRATRKAAAANLVLAGRERMVRLFRTENAKLVDRTSELAMQIRMTEARLSYALVDLAHEHSLNRQLHMRYNQLETSHLDQADELNRNERKFTKLHKEIEYLHKEVARKETVIQNYQAGVYN